MGQFGDVVVAGHICLDITPQLPTGMGAQFFEGFQPGRLLQIGPAMVSTGGAVSNTGLNLLKLGLNAQLMGRIGDDIFGQVVQTIVRRFQPDAAMTLVPGEQTSYTVVLSPPGMDRIFLHHPGANDTFCRADIDLDRMAGARLFHLGYPPLLRKLYLDDGAELVAIYRDIKEREVTTSLDLSLPDPNSESGRVDWRGLLERLLPYVDIPLFSAEEAMFMLDRARFEQLKQAAGGSDPVAYYRIEDLVRLAEELLRLGAAIAVIKCGHQGIYLRTADTERLRRMGRGLPQDLAEWTGRDLFEEVFRVERVASTTGAGDAAIAGFLAAFLQQHPPEYCLKTACCTGAQCIQALDALSGVGTWAETQALIPGWAKRRRPLEPPWRYDDAQRVWRGPHELTNPESR